MSRVFTQPFGIVSISFDDKLFPYSKFWFIKTNCILWKGKAQDILKSIEILRICTIVQTNISKAEKAIILQDVRLY